MTIFLFWLTIAVCLTLFVDFLSSLSIAVGDLPCDAISFMDDFRLRDGACILSTLGGWSEPESGFVRSIFVSPTPKASMGSYCNNFGSKEWKCGMCRRGLLELGFNGNWGEQGIQ